MAQLWNEFMQWYQNTHLDTILSWIITAGIPALCTFLIKRGNKSAVQEVKAIAKEKKISESYNKLSEGVISEVVSLNNKIDERDKKYEKQNELILSVLVLILKHAKIPYETKEKLVSLIKDGDTKVKEIINVTENKLVDIIDDVEKSIEEEKNFVEEPSVLDELVNSFKN